MWNSHTSAEPTNAWLGWGDFASDPELYTQSSLQGFDAWIGPGQLLSTPALFEGEWTRSVYFPKSSSGDKSLYFDLHAPYGTYTAGSTEIVSTPLEHMGLFAREGSVIPIGKPQATVTQVEGPARTATDGVDVQLEEEGGMAGLDDWRGVQIFPGEKGEYVGTWTEDDGISFKPEKSIIEVRYTAAKDGVEVQAKWLEHGFKPLWKEEIHVILPVKDQRKVKDAKSVQWGDRLAWVVQVA
jgi:alpha-glucosidase (family GH31 glycosyl hydrolase)